LSRQKLQTFGIRLFSLGRAQRAKPKKAVFCHHSLQRGNLMTDKTYIPAVKVQLAENGQSAKTDELGMREMQARAYKHRGEQYLLIKSPPASGKSRALMFIALDKLHRQGLKKAIICVPERAIGSSFADKKLTEQGFYWDWQIKPRWNLCNTEGSDTSRSKVQAVAEFLAGNDSILLCTHATFRFAFEHCGVAAFDNCLIAIDEFHHVSGDTDSNRLGRLVAELMARGKTHITAMTGSYFRGDSVPVLKPEDEEKFFPVTYTYYEQLNGYRYLKQLELGYYFYQGSYLDSIIDVLEPEQKTIIHIPNVNARESMGDKHKEVEKIIDSLCTKTGGSWTGEDKKTGFQLIRRADGRLLRLADLVDDEPKRRNRIITALKDPAQAENRDHVDIIIALGMAKEGFDWIWCEHALTVGYRSSLTEIVQIIGRCTRDAPGKSKARFTNLIAEPDASEENVREAVNDTLKAIAASLLMEQVLAPKFDFVPKLSVPAPQDGFDYGEGGYQPDGINIGHNPQTGAIQIEIKGLAEPKSLEAQRICTEDLQEVLTAYVQDKQTLERGLFDQENTIPEELTVERMGKIIHDKYPDLSDEDKEAIRQRAVAQLNLLQQGIKYAPNLPAGQKPALANTTMPANTALLAGVRKFVTDVRELNVDFIDRINPFDKAYAILSKAMNEQSLREMRDIIAVKKFKIEPDEARHLAARALAFKKDRGRWPNPSAGDPWEARMAAGAYAFFCYKKEGRYE